MWSRSGARWARALRIPNVIAAELAAGSVSVVSLRRRSADPARTLFQCASVSKPVTATAVLRLAAEGRIDVDAPVWPQLDGCRVAERFGSSAITVHELLTHTSGLVGAPDPVAVDEPLPAIDDALVAGVRVDPAARGRFAYSNANYALLQLLVERTTAEDFESAMRRLVFEPAGMTSTTTDWALTVPARRGIPHRARGLELEATRSVARGAGGLVSTAGDLGRFLDALTRASEPLLSHDVLARATTAMPGTEGAHQLPSASGRYGYGWLVDRIGDETLAWHLGNQPGWAAIVALLVERREGMVATTDASSGIPVLLHLLGAWSAGRVGGRPLPAKLVDGLAGLGVGAAALVGAAGGMAAARRLSPGAAGGLS